MYVVVVYESTFVLSYFRTLVLSKIIVRAYLRTFVRVRVQRTVRVGLVDIYSMIDMT